MCCNGTFAGVDSAQKPLGKVDVIPLRAGLLLGGSVFLGSLCSTHTHTKPNERDAYTHTHTQTHTHTHTHTQLQ